MTAIDDLAQDVHVSGRTLRRAAERGTFVAHRPTAKKVVVPVPERLYVRQHWPLLSQLIRELRTTPNVRLAVLFGSVARGDVKAESDLDIAVWVRDDDYRKRAALVERLESVSGRSVQLVSGEQLNQAPLLLAGVLRDGRVLVSRVEGAVAERPLGLVLRVLDDGVANDPEPLLAQALLGLGRRLCGRAGTAPHGQRSAQALGGADARPLVGVPTCHQ